MQNLESDPNQNVSRAIFEDSKGRYWVSVPGGIGEFDLITGKITMLYEKFPQIKSYKVVYNFYPVDDDIFSVVGESGIYYYNIKTDSIRIPHTDDPDSPKFPNYNIKYYCLYTDSRRLEWFGTERGIRIWDDVQKNIYHLTVDNGLPNNSVSGILEDNDGIIWVSTAQGISKIEVQNIGKSYEFSLVNFGISDGLQSGKFYDRSALKASDGTLYFGGVHGFNFFNPKEMAYNEATNKPMFTAFSLFNSRVKENVEYNNRIILKKPINHTDEIELRHNENFISFEFTGLNYVNPSQTYYKYKLQNFDEDWNEILADGSGKVTYTGLRPGTYKFVVYAANNDKVWGNVPAEVTIVINPPVWATNYAIFLYFVVGISLMYYLVYRFVKRSNRKLAEQKEINLRKQKEELDQIKFRFFTNISHEFRTPLSLIITPLEALIKQQNDANLKRKLELIKENANDLLKLVNQLLDFRKLEMSGEKLVLQKGNIIQFIEDIYLQFKDNINDKNIDSAMEIKTGRLIMFYDRDKFHKIINNLLSNAIKFTPEGGHIELKTETTEYNHRKYISISVSDTGCGIPEDEYNLIFDRFYQVKYNNKTQPGSGIGLHLVREYVNLHEGRIEIDSKVNSGSTFTVHIPIDLTGPEPAEKTVKEITSQEIKTDKESETREKTLLIVEDNVNFRNFLVEQLNTMFRIIEAEEGETGEKLALSESPDLIISDLMMPKVDGLELCQRLKKNIQTSHIPFILLTARSSDEAKIEGYEAGADSYISKPFNFEMLQTRILKLIEQQEKRKELFHKTIEITPSSITITSLDEELVQKALQYVEKNMDNTEYSIDDLGRDVGLSRSQLYRKLQSITGLSPLEFIRSIRLKRAAQLLMASQYNVSEIADIVGFNTLKYFNKYFKEEFRMTPTQYRQKNKNETVNSNTST